MNYPTSDIQFLALMILKVRADDQITQVETKRLNDIAAKGSSSPAYVDPGPGEAPQA